jgi:hypothetical protein
VDLPSRWLLFNAVIVLLVGLLAGIPYGIAINQKKSEHIVSAWRLAHASLSVGATTMFAISAVLTHLLVGVATKWLIVAAFVTSGYGFCFALPIAAWVGHRGLSWSTPTSNKIVYLGNSIGAWSSLGGTLVMLYAAYESLRM